MRSSHCCSSGVSSRRGSFCRRVISNLSDIGIERCAIVYPNSSEMAMGKVNDPLVVLQLLRLAHRACAHVVLYNRTHMHWRGDQRFALMLVCTFGRASDYCSCSADCVKLSKLWHPHRTTKPANC